MKSLRKNHACKTNERPCVDADGRPYMKTGGHKDVKTGGRPQGASLLYSPSRASHAKLLYSRDAPCGRPSAPHTLPLFRLGIALIFVLLTSAYFLFPRPVSAIGDTTIVQIVGPRQAPGFFPALLTIHQYDTVVFINKTNTPYALTTSDNSFSSPAIAAGQLWRTTFSALGAHEYHTTQPAQHMAGEILVVANTVSLLPTPVPQIEATALAIIKAGKHPPDTIVLPVQQQLPVQHLANTKQANALLSPLVLGIAAGVLLLLILLFVTTLLLRRHRRRVREEEEMDTLIEEIVPKTIAQKALPAPKQQKKRRPLLAGFRRRRTDDDEDDMDDEDEV